MTQENEKRFRQFEIMQQVAYMTDDHLGDIQRWLSGLAGVAYLCVLHDMDETSPHYHIFVKMKDARTLDDIAKQCNVEKQYINIRSKSWQNALAYAFHKTEQSREDGKHEYDASAVVFHHNINYENIIATDEEYKRKISIKKLMLQYGECEISKKVLFEHLTAKDFHENRRFYEDMKAFRATKMEARNMQVIYISGPAGSGKTTLAKYMAYHMNYDYFVSGSGKDALDGYDKEECIILDDLRADTFTKSELFKLTDNNTNSSVKSRYQNKDISHCKLLIITSIKYPSALYDWTSDTSEPAEQFARRLGHHFLVINADAIGSVMDCKLNSDLTASSFVPAGFNMSLVYGVMGIIKNDSKADLFMRSLADSINEAYKARTGSKNDKQV